MAKYIIHACPNRMNYVNDYLIPSMKEQDIFNIDLRCDDNNVGNLTKCMEIFSSMHDDGGTWHIQDDVIICRDFKTVTEHYDDGETVVCGFVWDQDDNVSHVGYVAPEFMWTFPCVYIPNHLAMECADWFDNSVKQDPKYTLWVNENRYDDYLFKSFLRRHYPDDKVLNLKPNLVDHIDYLIGGTMVNKWRRHEQIRSAYFEDLDLVEDLERQLGYKQDE